MLAAPVATLKIVENIPLNSAIHKFTATDSSAQCHGLILYSLVSGNEESRFQIDLLNGTLYVLNELDREVKSIYNLKIRSSDLYGNVKDLDLGIEIEDVNDNAPIFTNDGVYVLNLLERKQVGQVLLTVSATDIDAGTNGDIMYSLVNPSHLFNLDKNTGVLSLISPLSKEPYTEYFVDILASDRSQEENRVGYAYIHITVTELENNPPICLTNRQRIEVPTNTPAGVIVGRVFGYDSDLGKAGKLSYSILKKTLNFDDYFSLNRKTGLIRLHKGLLQKDKGFTFSISVKLRDSGEPLLSTICHVYKIIVDALGMKRPIFSHKQFPLVTSVSDYVAKGAVVTKLNVLKDNSSTVDVNYELVDGSGVGIFSIDKLIGTIYISNNVFKKSFYWLTVQAYMQTNPSVFTNAHILVKIKSKKLTRPFLSPSVYHVTVPTSNQIHRNVVQLFATSPKGGYSIDGIKFSIFAGDMHYFQINNDGWIQNHRKLNVGNYALNVTVGIQNSTWLSHGYVLVHVIDKVKYTQPRFGVESEDLKTVLVFETKGVKHPPYLFQPLASNPTGQNLRYEVALGSKFSINPLTAVVKSNNILSVGDAYFVNFKVSNDAKQSAGRMYVVEVIAKPPKGTKLSFKKKK